MAEAWASVDCRAFTSNDTSNRSRFVIERKACSTASELLGEQDQLPYATELGDTVCRVSRRAAIHWLDTQSQQRAE
ncbi:hypothetical protein [Rhizobium sp. 007]|uniref:hypothetical protein n=1 Tax=Rhizobium sp. 007 TaxID=2785056 RepID=UPI00188F983D|nr:hypothetical protein [Rhizobium sp. 007]QPB22369.1 hypothetical protein ISN39_22325 [Rhizobium sp. 007]